MAQSVNAASINNLFGLFNADSATLNQIEHFPDALKQQDFHIQNVVHGQEVRPEQDIFIQRAVYSSQLESAIRDITVTSYNSASIAVSGILSPFEIGSPNPVTPTTVKVVTKETISNEAEINFEQRNAKYDELERVASEISEILITDSIQKEMTTTSQHTHVATPSIGAPSFADQMQIAAKRHHHLGLIHE